MEQNIHLEPFYLETGLTGYMPIPRELTSMNLSSTAVLLYGVLLDRATLSQKNRYADGAGWIYVIYPIEKLAQSLHISDTAVKRHLRQLQDRGLIFRRRGGRGHPTHIHLNLPSGSVQGTQEERKCTGEGPKRSSATGRKVPTNNPKEQPDMINYYQYREEESL